MEAHEQMQAEREANRIKERQQAGLYARMLQHSRDRYNQAETMLHFQSQKNLEDTIFVQEKILDWMHKAKPDTTQKKILDEISVALVCMNAYTINVEMAAKQAVATSIRDNEALIPLEKEIHARDVKIKERDFEILKLNSEIKKLNIEIEKLKKQLDFGS